MKSRLTLVIALLMVTISIAQNGINYKAVVKDGSGNILASSPVTIQFIIYEGVTLSNNVYQESHTTDTDANGLIIVNIGEGTTSDTFADINWANDEHYLNVQINTGAGLADLGTTQFKTVPYALNAGNVSGLEAIDQGNGIGWRLKGNTTNGIIGSGAVALGNSNTASGGTALVGGIINIASGNGSVVFGSANQATAIRSTAFGQSNVASGANTTVFGTETNANAYSSFSIGKGNIGGGDPTNWVETDPLFEIGNSEMPINGKNNALTILKNGTITAPSFNLAEITDDKALITKEYADTNLIASGLEAIDEGNGIGWRLKGRDPSHYANIGLNAVNLGISTYPSTTHGASGISSTAMGVSTTASGFRATAIGFSTTSSGTDSMAMGSITTASGGASTAIGSGTTASGAYSTAMGRGTAAPSSYETAIGRYNTIYIPNEVMSWNANDRLFVIGNGANFSNKSDALTVLKNGKLYLTPTHDDAELADASGYLIIGEESGENMVFDNNEIMARDNATNSPLYLQRDGGNVSIGNVGVPNAALDVLGSIQYTGTITDVSDKRLKENFKAITNPLEKLQNIKGYSYNMIADDDTIREYGVIAQDVQKVFPEMVTTVDDEAGYLGVSYSQLIPVLLEAIKEQNKRIDELEARLNSRENESIVRKD